MILSSNIKKALFLVSFLAISNILLAQLPAQCETCLKKLVQSCVHYKKRFGNKDIFLNKKWNYDASSDGYNLFFTIYYENTKVGTYNRIVTYELEDHTKKLSVKDTFNKYNSSDISYDKKLLPAVYKICAKNKVIIQNG